MIRGEIEGHNLINVNDTDIQDRREYLWFGTEYGLNRYDDYNYSRIQAKSVFRL